MILQLQSRDRLLVGGLLVLFSAAAWIITLRIMSGDTMVAMGDMMKDAGAPERLFLFLGTWSLMMAAMMLPSTLPMVITYASAVRKQNSLGHVFARSAVFVIGYLALWSSAGLLFFVLNGFVSTLPSISSTLGVPGALLTGATLIVAAAYQLSPLKERCLIGCRMPLGFVASHWREGFGGGFRMGVEHGLDCVGCCATMFVVLVVVGLMNLPAMVLLTLVIASEKLLPFGPLVAKLAAGVMMGSGILLIFAG